VTGVSTRLDRSGSAPPDRPAPLFPAPLPGPVPATATCGLPGGNPGENIKSISHIFQPILVAFVWELAKETIDLPLGCL